VVALFGAIDDTVTAVGAELAVLRAAPVRAVEDAVVAFLRPVPDAVATMGREDATRGASAVLAGIEKGTVITLLWRLNHTVATADHLATEDAIRVVRHLRLAVLAVLGLDHTVATSGC
jgi:hypothetical protein